MTDPAADLAAFITAAPSPYHAVAEGVRLLEAAGFTEHVETDPWPDGPGGRYLVRDGTVLAWSVPAGGASGRPLRVFAAHTDSPTLKVKPNPDTGAAGWRQVGRRGLRRRAVELLAGPRPRAGRPPRPLRRLHRAGRRAPAAAAGAAAGDPPRPAGQPGPHPGSAAAPPPDLGTRARPPRATCWSSSPARSPTSIPTTWRRHDLVVHDVNPPARLGEEEELLAAPRLDNLASVHAGHRRAARRRGARRHHPRLRRVRPRGDRQRARPPARRGRCWRTCSRRSPAASTPARGCSRRRAASPSTSPTRRTPTTSTATIPATARCPTRARR